MALAMKVKSLALALQVKFLALALKYRSLALQVKSLALALRVKSLKSSLWHKMPSVVVDDYFTKCRWRRSILPARPHCVWHAHSHPAPAAVERVVALTAQRRGRNHPQTGVQPVDLGRPWRIARTYRIIANHDGPH